MWLTDVLINILEFVHGYGAHIAHQLISSLLREITF